MGGHVKRCFNCGREDTQGFDQVDGVRSYRIANGQLTRLPAPATWVCRPGFGCEGEGPLHFTFWKEGGEA
jgi:hypothetical protein